MFKWFTFQWILVYFCVLLTRDIAIYLEQFIGATHISRQLCSGFKLIVSQLTRYIFVFGQLWTKYYGHTRLNSHSVPRCQQYLFLWICEETRIVTLIARLKNLKEPKERQGTKRNPGNPMESFIFLRWNSKLALILRCPREDFGNSMLWWDSLLLVVTN